MNSETRTTSTSSVQACQNCKQPFTIEPEDFTFYEKIKVPPPTWCWRCRAIRRMSFRNMTHLYPRICAATGKKIYTLMPPEAPMPVYNLEYWMSDAWDPLSYGHDYDFSRPFFEQFQELYHQVPYGMITSVGSVNSDYSSTIWSKNCYLCFDGGFGEDSAHNVTLQRSKQCFDTINCKVCELCYFSINISNSYKVFFSRNCSSCSEVWFSQDCIGCTNCFGCTGLRNKSYFIFNEPHTKETYKRKLEELGINSWSGIEILKRRVMEVWRKYPVKYMHSVQAKGCTGDYLFHASELRNCFFADGAQNCAHSQSIIYSPIKDCMDITSSGVTIELCYETCCSGADLSKVFFCMEVNSVTNSQYSMACSNSNNLFGCVGVRKKNYCVLNKQYSKEEYNALVSKIIEHMDKMPYVDAKGRVYKYGEFFPPEMSPFGYNITQGQEYFPMTQQEAEAQGLKWREPEKKSYTTTKTSKDLPDTIGEVGDEITSEVIQCAHDEKGNHPFDCAPSCSTAFRIIPQEIQFYRQMKLPIPRLCFHCRHFERVAWRNKPALYSRKCACAGTKSGEYQNGVLHFHGDKPCPNEFETSFASDRAEIVYCEQCYNSEIA